MDEVIDAKPDEPHSQAPPNLRPTPEELVARAVAPVKAEYLRPPPVRSNEDEARGGHPDEDDDTKEKKSTLSSSNVVKEKKSKRQLKRERKQEQNSVVHICTEVARSGNVDSCPYGGNCRFNHDLNAYLAQKPADLEGTCPFIALEEPCPYGVTCRFSNTHKNNISLKPQNIHRKRDEINVLKKDLQKLLWKNKVNFPKADAQLKILGLKGVNRTKEKSEVDHVEIHQDNLDGSYDLHRNEKDKMLCSMVEKLECAPAVCDCSDDASIVNGSSLIDESRPLKKTKSQVDESQKIDISSGASCTEIDLRDTNEPNKPSPEGLSSCKVDLIVRPHPRERKLIDFREKLYLAPLTTVGNLPFRRVCKILGADITCGEMAMCTNLLQGQASEWALLRRHSSEDIFGVQICGAYPDTVARTVELVSSECSVDFIDINMGCPIDIVVNRGAGSSLLTKPMRMKSIIQAASCTTDKPLTVKVRTGYFEGRNRIDSLVSDIGDWGASALTIHGRSRQQRYSKLADWDYIYQCARKAPENLHVLGNGDIFSYSDWNRQFANCTELSSCMIARGALIKPWIFTEIKEQRHWDITSGERLNILRDFVHFGLEHWGCDTKGVETTRHFLLEWLSYTYRYIPVGLLDVVPQRLNWRPPSYYGRNDLETLLASDSAADWIRISEMLLGKVPEGFNFAPKHKSNAYDRAENG